MTADTVYEVAMALSIDEQKKLYTMLQAKIKNKAPLITEEEAEKYILKQVFGLGI